MFYLLLSCDNSAVILRENEIKQKHKSMTKDIKFLFSVKTFQNVSHIKQIVLYLFPEHRPTRCRITLHLYNYIHGLQW